MGNTCRNCTSEEGVFKPEPNDDADAATITTTITTTTPATIAAKIDNPSDDELHICKTLLDGGQEHLFKKWPPCGEETADKKRFLQQALVLDTQIPGGLSGYISRAKKLLSDSKNSVNPYEGYIPEVPLGATLDTESADGLAEFKRFECEGMKQVGDACFVMVAGGLGERLGYNGIKIALPSDICSNVCFLGLYCQYILALQTRARSLKKDDSIVIPLVIMTSGDTDEKTCSLLKANKNFGMGSEQIRIIKQEKVPALNDNEAKFVLDDSYSILTKPHGHGDVHTLIFQQGLAEKWAGEGGERKKWIVFLQDTNGLVFRALPAALGVSSEKKLAVNSLTVPRKPGEAVGAICKLRSSDKPSMTINVEYNQLDALMKASDKVDEIGENGFSSFPGNINVLIFEAQSYATEMKKSEGKIAEFVNPKYKDTEKTIFKKPTRLECMMQDYPKCLGPDIAVGFTQCDRWTCFSAVKNNIKDAVAKFEKTGYAECAASGEADIYKAHRKALQMAGAEIDVQGKINKVQNIPVEDGARVILSPSFACTLDDIRNKIEGPVKISNDSTLVLQGASIKIKKLDLDGALIVRVGDKATLTINAEIKNEGWKFEDVNPEDENVDEKLKIRGYKLKKNAKAEFAEFDLTDKKGNYQLTTTADGPKLTLCAPDDLLIRPAPTMHTKTPIKHGNATVSKKHKPVGQRARLKKYIEVFSGQMIMYDTEKKKTSHKLSLGDVLEFKKDEDNDKSFLITTKDSKKYSFEVDNSEERDEWLKALNRDKVVEFTSDSENEWGFGATFGAHISQWHVNSVKEGKQAYIKGVRLNDRIILFNDEEVTKENSDKVKETLKNGKPCTVTFRRHEQCH